MIYIYIINLQWYHNSKCMMCINWWMHVLCAYMYMCILCTVFNTWGEMFLNYNFKEQISTDRWILIWGTFNGLWLFKNHKNRLYIGCTMCTTNKFVQKKFSQKFRQHKSILWTKVNFLNQLNWNELCKVLYYYCLLKIYAAAPIM